MRQRWTCVCVLLILALVYAALQWRTFVHGRIGLLILENVTSCYGSVEEELRRLVHQDRFQVPLRTSGSSCRLAKVYGEIISTAAAFLAVSFDTAENKLCMRCSDVSDVTITRRHVRSVISVNKD